MKLQSITPSTRAGKKWQAVFVQNDGSTKTVHFGDASMQDYTQHHDAKRRDAYRARHRTDLNTRDPTRAGYLSFFVLWGQSTDMQQNIKAYRSRFNL